MLLEESEESIDNAVPTSTASTTASKLANSEPLRTITVRIPASLNKRLALHRANTEETIQDTVARAVKRLLDAEDD